MRWPDYQPTQPIATDKGIVAHSQSGTFAANWWAQRWIEALEHITDAGRLRRGRSYARKGQVLSIEEKSDANRRTIQARVQGSRPAPYKVTISIQPLSDAQWQAVLDVLSERALFAAQLLAGEMPHEIEEAFAASGASLFPSQEKELVTACTCPDWANPCKHVAATYYILGEQFDEDPFLLFRLRGRSQEQITAALRTRQRQSQDAGPAQLATDAETNTTAQGDEVALAEAQEAYGTAESPLPVETTAEDPPLEEQVSDFWRMRSSLAHFPVTIAQPQPPFSVLRRLGQPSFVNQNLEQLLAPIYTEVSRNALNMAFPKQKPVTDESKQDEEN